MGRNRRKVRALTTQQFIGVYTLKILKIEVYTFCTEIALLVEPIGLTEPLSENLKNTQLTARNLRAARTTRVS